MKRTNFKIIALLFVILSTISYGSTSYGEPFEDINSIIKNATHRIMMMKREQGYWDQFNYTFGDSRGAQTFVGSRILGLAENLDKDSIEKNLRRSQLEDGSWLFLNDGANQRGDISATVLNYLFFKSIGTDLNDPVMVSAKNFIKDQGGIENTRFDTRFFLAILGAYSWDQLITINLNIAVKAFEEEEFAKWVAPSFYPMFYMMINRVTRPLAWEYPERYALKELYINEIPEISKSEGYSLNELSPLSLFTSLHIVEDMILKNQDKEGSWKGYLNATTLNILVLEHFIEHIDDLTSRSPIEVEELRERSETAISKAYQFQENFFWNRPLTAQGMITDSRFWDTGLLLTGLLEAGVAKETLYQTGHFLANNQSENGGFPFGIDFGKTPDTDDTAIILLALHQLQIRKEEQELALKWILDMQNEDGGWAAFSRDIKPVIFEFALNDFAPTHFFYDFSSPDITGHILETLAAMRYNKNNSTQVQKAIDFLKSHQTHFGNAHSGWKGTWGVNYIYGTSAALIGLLKAGEQVEEPYIQESINWLLSIQNPDGGFGESNLSYVSESWIGKGSSTPSQTAWVLLALLEANIFNNQVDLAIDYLIREYRKNGKWIDTSAVGTIHNGYPHLDYPVYPEVFPLIALSRYQKKRK